MTSPIAEVERGFRSLLLDVDEQLFPDVDPVRQRVYRRLVRGNLFSAVRRAIPITRNLLGEEVIDALCARWLADVGPRTRLVRQVAAEFTEWLMAQPSLPHEATGELAHWEALEIEVGLAADYDGPTLPRTPSPTSHVETHPSTRLAAYRHHVHALTTSSTAYPAPSAQPAILLAWRSGERFTWQELDGGVAKTLVEVAQGKTLGEAYAAVTSSLAEGDVFDVLRVNAALVDLCRRGAVVGFPLPGQ